MKYTFFLVSVLILATLSSCGKKDETYTQVPSDTELTQEETLEEQVDALPNDTLESTGAELIVPQYVDNIETLNEGTDEKILFFYSESSEASKTYDNLLRSEDKPEFYSDIIKIDFDSESEAKERYEVDKPNTFILIDEEWNLVTRADDIKDISEILSLYE